MIEAIATRSVLIRQERREGKKVDVSTRRGEKIKLTEEEAIKFWGALDLTDKDKKSLQAYAKKEGIKRRI
jgi:hypothetical protein